MSGLSNRVMNMKFMQKADALVESKKTEEQEKKIKDMSEWVLPNSFDLLKNRKKNEVNSIGYASINSFGGSLLDSDDENSDLTSTIPTRRIWGTTKVKMNEDNVPKLDISNLKSTLNIDKNSKKGSDAKIDNKDHANISKPKDKSKKRNNNNVDNTSNNKKKKAN